MKKYANPVKTFKVGSKNYASKFNKDYISVLYDQEKLSGKLEISPNKNWKLKKIWLSKARTSKVVKNGDKISGYGVRATLKNTKTKVTEDIELDVDDGN